MTDTLRKSPPNPLQPKGTNTVSEMISFDDHRAAKFLERAFAGFLGDPADSDHQRGYLAGLLALYTEGLGKGVGDDRITLLRQQTEEMQ